MNAYNRDEDPRFDGNNFGKNRHFTSAFILILVGAAFLLYNLNLFPFPIGEIILSWQTLLIVLGIVALFRKQFVGAGVMIFLGIVFILPKLKLFYPEIFGGIPTYSFSLLWPVVLIIVGVGLLLNKVFPSKQYKWNKNIEKGFDINWDNNRGEAFQNIDTSFDVNTMFNGTKHIILTQNLQKGEVNVMFGEAILNLEKAELSPENAMIKASVLFGSIIIKVPPHWNVNFDTSSLFGSGEDKRTNCQVYDPEKPVLYIKGSCLFGSIELTN